MKLKLLLYSLALLGIFSGPERAATKISDIFNSTGTIIEGIGHEVIKRIPTPLELFHVSIQVLFGFPEMAVFESIRKSCTLYMAAGTIKPRITPDVDTMTLTLHTPCKELIFPLNNVEKLLESPEFDVNKPVVIFSTGWKPALAEDYLADMINAYNCRGSDNFLTLNSSDAVDTLYTWSAYNTQAVGGKLGVTVEELLKWIPVNNIQLIGHSLGAHIVGYAGRYLTEKTGKRLPRITGLDPANPCFDEGNNVSGLQRGDAEFIDVIHSNYGGLGISESVGDADFYPGGVDTVKPGCVRFPCSHFRSFEYYTESVYPGNERNFLAVRCTSVMDVEVGACKGERYPMGYAVPLNLQGNYYLSVNGKKPFGQNNNRTAVPSACRKCQQ